MGYNSKFLLYKDSLFKTGEIFFQCGIFFLPTLFPLALILFFLSLLISLFTKNIDLNNDRWNQVLLFSGVVLIRKGNISDQLINNSITFLLLF